MANDNNNVIQYPAWLDFAVAGVIPCRVWVAIAKAGRILCGRIVWIKKTGSSRLVRICRL